MLYKLRRPNSTADEATQKPKTVRRLMPGPDGMIVTVVPITPEQESQLAQIDTVRKGVKKVKSNELTDIEIHLHHETALAFRVSTDGNDDTGCWVPKSLSEFLPGQKPYIGTLTLPLWLAEEKGLV